MSIEFVERKPLFILINFVIGQFAPFPFHSEKQIS